MPRNFGNILAEQLATSPLVKETDNYMESQVLNPDAQPVVVDAQQSAQPNVVSSQPPVATDPAASSVGKPSLLKYPAPFLNNIVGAPKHCQALVNATTYANMSMLKTVGALPSNMSLGAMANAAIEDWVDKKIREYVKKQGK